ncbi:MAG TPA: antibiotic biosynthesis monooxygenase [Actinospica sp.]|jgi:quinol monooxygenase YgiN|nr:antibiotic biosynthesis monooxygenase [Actinospica sp.]
MKVGLLARIEAKPEFADEVAAMLGGALELALAEDATVTWFAFRESATVFGVFDTFDDEGGRQAHLAGPIAAALMEAAETKLASPPEIRPIDLLAVKVP